MKTRSKLATCDCDTAESILTTLIRIIDSQEQSASRIYAAYDKSKGFDPARLFAKTQAQAIFQVTSELRLLVQEIDDNNRQIHQKHYRNKQPEYDKAHIQLS